MTSILAKSPKTSGAALDQRQAFLDAAKQFFDQARDAAEQGMVAESAGLILRALDQERRAGGVGPQVMQLIKPRN